MPDPTITNIPMIFLKFTVSSKIIHPRRSDQIIIIYSNGAIVGGEAIRYAW